MARQPSRSICNGLKQKEKESTTGGKRAGSVLGAVARRQRLDAMQWLKNRASFWRDSSVDHRIAVSSQPIDQAFACRCVHRAAGSDGIVGVAVVQRASARPPTLGVASSLSFFLCSAPLALASRLEFWARLGPFLISKKKSKDTPTPIFRL
jgi:hypothetical protein